MINGGFGGFNQANQAALLQQQASDQFRTQSILARIGQAPQGGPTNTHGDVNRAVNLGGATTSVESAPGNAQLVSFFQAPAPEWAKGLGVDLNGDGKFEAGIDGHLALDLDGNGIYDKKDIKDTLRMLQLFSGETKSNQTGFSGFSQATQAETLLLQTRGKQADINQDGVLSGWELSKMGAKVLTGDKNASGEAGTLTAHTVPGAYAPDYQAQPSYYPQATTFGGNSAYSSPMNYGPPAYFMQVLSSFMSLFARPY